MNSKTTHPPKVRRLNIGPYLIQRQIYGLNANRAIGLGVVLLSLNSLLLAFVHALYFGGVPWDMAAFTMLAVLWGGRLGPFLAQWISPRTTKKVFTFIALLDGLMITRQASYVTFFR